MYSETNVVRPIPRLSNVIKHLKHETEKSNQNILRMELNLKDTKGRNNVLKWLKQLQGAIKGTKKFLTLEGFSGN